MSRNVPCPTCEAPLGSPCRGHVASGGYHIKRTAAHRAAYVKPKRRKGAPRRAPKKYRPVHAASSGRGPRKGSLRPEDLRVLRESLERLGMRNLIEYTRSPEWQRMVGLFERQQEIPKACVVCGSHHYFLHHRTYKRLGCEWMTDLVPLCSEHHDAAHELLWARAPGVTLWNAHTKL